MTTNLTINQGLRRAKVLKGQIKEWMERAKEANVTMAGNSKSPYEYDKCLSALDASIKELIEVETRIAMTNAFVIVEWNGAKMPLAQAVRILANCKSNIAFYKSVPTLNANEVERLDVETTYDRKSGDYIQIKNKVIDTCSAPKLVIQDAIDKAQKDFDDLNGVVEAANHLSKLVTLPG